MIKLEVIKKTDIQTCWACDGIGCKVCKNTGKWKETNYYHIYKGKDGKKYCIDGDTIK
jgi:hypothetical protein